LSLVLHLWLSCRPQPPATTGATSKTRLTQIESLGPAKSHLEKRSGSRPDQDSLLQWMPQLTPSKTWKHWN
jgi:hypothetical protein